MGKGGGSGENWGRRREEGPRELARARPGRGSCGRERNDRTQSLLPALAAGPGRAASKAGRCLRMRGTASVERKTKRTMSAPEGAAVTMMCLSSPRSSAGRYGWRPASGTKRKRRQARVRRAGIRRGRRRGTARRAPRRSGFRAFLPPPASPCCENPPRARRQGKASRRRERRKGRELREPAGPSRQAAPNRAWRAGRTRRTGRL